MNDLYVPNEANGVFHAIHLPEFGLTWAGPNPFDDGMCFGSETGNIALTDVSGKRVGPIYQATASGEAVNGVAISQNWLAVTSRKDINLIGPFVPGRSGPEMVTIFCGGRDVAVAPTSGYFVIPLGPDGIMFVKPGTGEKDPVTISKSDKIAMNFCRVLALPGARGNDVIVCAGRRGGLAYSEYTEGIRGHTLHTVTFTDLDLVDVCSLATPENPLAVVSAAKDGSLVLFHDILADKSPKIVKFKGVNGTVYRVLSTQGDIYLLTSKGLFGLFRLASGFLEGDTFHHVTTNVLRMAIEASDANMVRNKWLIAVGAEDVLRFDIEKMPKSPDSVSNAKNGDGREEPEHVTAMPQWEESNFEQKSEYVAAVV